MCAWSKGLKDDSVFLCLMVSKIRSSCGLSGSSVSDVLPGGESLVHGPQWHLSEGNGDIETKPLGTEQPAGKCG